MKIKYFYDTNAVVNKEMTESFYIMLTSEVSSDTPPLTEEIMLTNAKYRRFNEKYKSTKIKTPIFIEYKIYKAQTEFEEEKGFEEDFFKNLIEQNKADFVSSSELQIDRAEATGKPGSKKSKKIKVQEKKKKKQKISKPILIGGGTGILIFGMLLGSIASPSKTNPPINNIPTETKEVVYSQFTVTLDQSYRPIPAEDIVLKAEIDDNGKAMVTLPSFSNTDFFNHIPGYTYGYSTVPNTEKIEFYGGQSIELTANLKLYRVLSIYGGGSGTKDDPYLISYFDQLELLAKTREKAYFKQTANIVFPINNTSINIFSNLKEKGTEDDFFVYDGNNFAISGLTSPLFGEVSGASFKNINIKNSVINSLTPYDFGFIAAKARSYKYTVDDTDYETGDVVFSNCTVKNCSIIITEPPKEDNETEPELIETEPEEPFYDENGNEIPNPYLPPPPPPDPKVATYSAGAIVGNGGIILNCLVSDFVIQSTSENKYFLNAGGLAGKPTEIKNSGAVNINISGNIFNAGGLCGSAEGTRLYNAAGEELPTTHGGSILGSFVRNGIIGAENNVGGIAGLGASDGKNPIIGNCYAAETSLTAGIIENDNIIKPGNTGGILGSDGNGENGHFLSRIVGLDFYNSIGKVEKSTVDETVYAAPANSFVLESILDTLNRGIVISDDVTLLTGEFVFEQGKNNNCPFPATLSDYIPYDKEQEEDFND